VDQINWAGIVIAGIGVISAWLAGRAAQNAAKYSARTEAETEAYNRARNMDLKTIERQDEEIEEIRKNNEDLRQKVRTLMQDNQRLRQEVEEERQDKEALRRRVSHLEEQLGGQSG
jgi:chromosome segregation ATPase